jgi:hypothetical protein
MVMRGALGPDAATQGCSLLVDTTHSFTVALDNKAWAKAGVNPASLLPVPGGGQMRHGVLPTLRLGAFEIPRVPAITGESVIKQREDGLDVDLDGLIGSGLLATFRVTLVDGGRTMWLEDLPAEALNQPSLFANPPPAGDQPVEDEPEVEAPAQPAPGKSKPAPKPAKPAAPPKPSAPAPAAAPPAANPAPKAAPPSPGNSPPPAAPRAVNPPPVAPSPGGAKP